MKTVGYDLDYLNGKYIVQLEEQKDKTYVYKTEFTIDVVYTLAGQDPVTKQDKITTKVLFEAAADNFAPTYSEKTIVCHSPLNVSDPEKVEECYYGGEAIEYSVVTTYAKDSSEGTSVKTNLKTNQAETLSFKKGSKYTFFDNEQLPFALRAISSSVTTAKIKTYSPFPEASQTIAISFASEAESALDFDNLKINGEEKKKSYSYREASMKIDATNSGVTQKLYIATKATERNMILKMETPLSYSLGTLVYTLSSIDRTE